MTTKTRQQRYKEYLSLMNKDKPKTPNLGKQISNAETRLTDSGEKADSRNWLEKLFNVKEKQNVLFDVAEVLGRPQQALFGGIKAAQKGENVLKAAKEGITGEDYTYGGELLRNAGMKDSGDKLGLDDVVGFAADIVADPTNLAFGAGAASKVGKGASALSKGAEVLSDTGKSLGILGDSNKVLNKAGKAVGYLDTASNMVKPIKKDLTQRAFEAVGDFVVKPTVKLADSTLEAGLKVADARKGITYADEFAKRASDLGKTAPIQDFNKLGKLEAYKKIKNEIGDTFNYAKSLPNNIIGKVRASKGDVQLAKTEAEVLQKQTLKEVDNYVNATGKTAEDTQKSLQIFKEAQAPTNFNAKQIIQRFSPSNDSTKYVKLTNVDDLNKLTKELDNLGINYRKIDSGANANVEALDDFVVRIDSIPKKVLSPKNADTLNKLESVNFESYKYTPEEEALIKSLGNDPEFMNLYNKVEGSYKGVSEIFKKRTGVDLSHIVDRPGYVRRPINLDYKKSVFKGDPDKTLKTSTQVFSGRKYANAMVANRVLGQDLFKMNFSEGLKDFIDVSSKQIDGIKSMQEVLFTKTMQDENLVKFYDGKDIPSGMVKKNSLDISEKVNAFKNLLPEGTADEFLQDVKGKDLLIDKRVYNLISNNFTKTEPNAFLKVVDTMNNTFKKLKVLSPGFHLRNITGNYSNMVLSGVPGVKVLGLYKDSTRILNNAERLISEGSQGLLKSSQDIKDYDLLSDFVREGFYKAGNKVNEIEDIANKTKKGIPNFILNKNQEANLLIDGMNRMALLKYAKENPGYVAKLGAETPGQAVRFTLFDPDDLSGFEKDVVKRVIPFYTFAKQNLMFHFQNSVKNPTKYKQLVKATNEIWDGSFEEGEYQQWQKQGFELPLPFLKDENGNSISLKTNLPLSDLGEYMSDPLRRITASTSPLIKAPFEAVSGIDMFTGRELSDKSALDFVARNTGLDLFTKQADKVGKLAELDSISPATLAVLLPSVARTIDKEQNITSNQYQQLDELNSYIKKLKETGVKVRTINDIKAPMKARLQRIKKSRNKYK